MAIRLKLTKKWKIIIIVIFVLILGGSGAYLLWRTNQPDTVAPTDSEAGSNQCNCCPPAYPNTKKPQLVDRYTPGCKPCDCTYAANACSNTSGTSFLQQCAQGCSKGSQCPACTWPDVGFCESGKCVCKKYNTNSLDPCNDKSPTCTLNCGEGYGDPYFIDAGGSCKSGEKSVSCSAKCAGCDNPYNAKGCCKPTPVVITNTCDSGEWLTKPTGSYDYCDPITYTAKAKDKDGIDKTSVVAKLNSATRPSVSLINETTTTLDISESLSTPTNCLPAGTYTVDLSWKDKKGATSTACTLTTTFSILAEEQNPDWTITKTGAEQCLEDGDAQVIYTIKIKNVGTGTGSIDKVVDALDSKVLASYITGTISEGGLFGSGSITWELEAAEETFAANQEKTYTYTLVIPKTAFGSYTNMVTAYPTAGDNFSDSVEVTVDCIQDVPVPQTGLFDSTVAKIVAGIVLLLLGFNLHRVDSGFKNVQNSLNKLTISMQDNQSERRKRNFEKKIVKK